MSPTSSLTAESMEKSLDQYRKVVGDEQIAQIFEEVSQLYDLHILAINSAFRGGGVAEILSNMIPLMNDAGLDIGWRILHGSTDFFRVTKKFHNALQGKKIHFTDLKKVIYREVNRSCSIYTHIDHDLVIIHDPQPLPLIKFYKKNRPWLWRCHVDLSEPNPEVWDFLKTFVLRYEEVILSSEDFVQEDLPTSQRILYPSIDPLSIKNKRIAQDTINRYLAKNNIQTDKPIIAQISRFDSWKDPLGMIKVFDLVKKEIDCQLVLLGGMARDDPEGQDVYEEITRKIGDREDVTLCTNGSDIFVNALQRSASVILQLSIKEGFCLAVTEALWKKTPVVATAAGGIPIQVKDGETGYLVEPKDYQKAAERVIQILENPSEAEEFGQKASQYVKDNFLITKHILNWLKIIKETVD